MAYTTMIGQRTRMLCKAAALLRELNALDAYISRTASVPSASMILCMEFEIVLISFKRKSRRRRQRMTRGKKKKRKTRGKKRKSKGRMKKMKS